MAATDETSERDRRGSPLISVAMITYNHERYIGQAIEAVLMQKVSGSMELIIGEDRSSDSTREIVTSYAERFPDTVKAVLRDRNIGPVPNWVDVLLRCRGDYIAVLEGDDYWSDQAKLQRQLDFLEKNPDVSGVYHSATLIDEDGREVCVIPEDGNDFYSVAEFLNTRYRIPTLSVFFRNFYRNEPPEKVRRTYEGLYWVGDFLNDLMIISHGVYRFMPDIMGVYRNHLSGGSSFSSLALARQLNEGIQVRKNGDAYFNHEYRDLFARSIRDFTLNPFIEFLNTGRYRQAIRLFFRLPAAEKRLVIRALCRGEMKR